MKLMALIIEKCINCAVTTTNTGSFKFGRINPLTEYSWDTLG